MILSVKSVEEVPLTLKRNGINMNSRSEQQKHEVRKVSSGYILVTSSLNLV